MWALILVILVFMVVLYVTCIKIVPQATSYVVERLGTYQDTWDTGFHFKIPFIDRVSRRISMKEQIIDFPPQPVITKDNVTMEIDTVVFYQITDPKLYVYGVEHPIVAIENLAATTLRNLIGEMELDQTLTSREIINTKMRAFLDEATDPWGIKVNRVEVKNIIPPQEIQAAMEKQMKAERERREQILQAEGEKQSTILRAEGEKQSAILRAEAQKESMIKEAEGHAESIRLHKEAEAAGLIAIKEAEAAGVIKMVEAGLTTDQIVKVRSLQSFEAVSDGQATKIIIPSDIQNVTGIVSAVAEATRN